MDTIDAILMGLVQGLAEYLPVSSSGHLEIMRNILGLDMDGSDALEFDVALHVATVLSTVVVLWREFFPLCRDFFCLRTNSEGFSYVCKILLSCIPVGIVGVLFKDYVAELFGSGLTVVGVCLIVTALLLSFTYFSKTRKELVPRYGVALTGISWKDAFVIGCSQALAVLPGLSRSGTTIATGILLGCRREDVARFSFFMVIIPILGEALLDIKDMLGAEAVSASVGMLPLVCGFVTSFVVGCIACKWMLEIVKKGKLVWFSLYCAAMGILCLVW